MRHRLHQHPGDDGALLEHLSRRGKVERRGGSVR